MCGIRAYTHSFCNCTSYDINLCTRLPKRCPSCPPSRALKSIIQPYGHPSFIPAALSACPSFSQAATEIHPYPCKIHWGKCSPETRARLTLGSPQLGPPLLNLQQLSRPKRPVPEKPALLLACPDPSKLERWLCRPASLRSRKPRLELPRAESPRTGQPRSVSSRPEPPPSPSPSDESSDDEGIFIDASGRVRKSMRFPRSHAVVKLPTRGIEVEGPIESEPITFGAGLSMRYSHGEWRERTAAEILEDAWNEERRTVGKEKFTRQDQVGCRPWYSPCRWFRGKY